MKPKTTHILFDCDNTLVLSEALAFEACAELANEILSSQDVTDRYTGDELMVDFVGKNFRGMLLDLQDKYKFTIPSEQLEKYVAMEEDKVIEKLKEKLVPCAGANEILKKLAQSGKYQMGVSIFRSHFLTQTDIQT
ncbi:HAD superfamily hydrolase [Lentinula edodes]|uniref:HAD superfamily hydrolase n=1 Tax=Lentinula edodes TaxID=5353 RepID=A0A1Q3EK79_LENED|nr:HAD superfamily hydrolase [Lentinula edodes]